MINNLTQIFSNYILLIQNYNYNNKDTNTNKIFLIYTLFYVNLN